MFLYEYDEEGVMESLKQEAREEGKAQEKLTIAKALLKTGVDLNTISQCTGISVEELKKL